MEAKYTNSDQQFLAAVTAYVEQYISKQVITLAMAGDSLQMMIDEHRNISEAADRSGFKDIPYFHTCFKQEYGMTPLEYLNNVTTKIAVQ